MTPKKVCCITLNPAFMPGFKAMMRSVLEHTDNFSERIVCLDLQLSKEDRRACRGVYPDIEFVEPLHKNYQRLPDHANALRNAFYKLEIFRLARHYNRLLFLLFAKPLGPVVSCALGSSSASLTMSIAFWRYSFSS